MIRWIATGRTKLSILYFMDKNSPPWKRVSAGQSLEAIEVNQQIRNDAPKTERLSASRSLIRLVQVDTDRQFCRRCGAPPLLGYPTTAFFECPTAIHADSGMLYGIRSDSRPVLFSRTLISPTISSRLIRRASKPPIRSISLMRTALSGMQSQNSMACSSAIRLSSLS